MREVRAERGGRELRGIAALAVGRRDDRAASELAGRADADRGGEPDRVMAEARHVGLTERAQSFVREHEGRVLLGAAADDQGEQLVIGERDRATRDEPLARSHGFGPLADGDVPSIGRALRRTWGRYVDPYLNLSYHCATIGPWLSARSARFRSRRSSRGTSSGPR